jgi:transposase
MNYYHSKIMMYHLVKQMDYEGHSITKIAEHFGINWRTVKRMLSMSEQEFTQGLEKGRLRKRSLDAYESFIKEKLTAYPDTSSAQMHDWLKEHHPDFPGVSQKTVFNFVQHLRDRYNIPKAESVREYVCVPELPYGLQGQVDFGFYNMKTTLGKMKKVQFFTFVLSRSRYKYIFFNDIPFTTEMVISAHEKAFEFIGGYPDELVYDQDRLFMVSENLGDLILTGEFRGYVKQRGFETWFCRKADPETYVEKYVM